jgi:hypothetical protein
LNVYNISFTVHGETPVKVQTIKATSEKDVKGVLLASGCDVDEIVSCYEM